jgi:pimeloyl-ACP methyl ester carboxylesterase
VRGYGESEMLSAYDEPADANDPPVRAWDAAQDVNAAYEFVSERHDTTHLLGVSWGTMTGGSFLEQYDGQPASFVQCAPVYKSPVDFEAAAAALGLDTDLVAHITEEYEVVKERQGGGEVFEAVWSAIAETDQFLDDQNAYIAQTGAIADTRDCCEGNPPYDAAAIDVPTLVVRGTEDHTSQREDALTLYDELDVEGERSEYAELRGGDHFVMHGQRRHDLYAATNAFFDRI